VLLEDRFVQNMARAAREQTLVAVLYLDIDNFKDVNDSLGRSYGDLMLQYVSEALRSMLRESDTVCRYSSDEFVILVNDLTSLDEVARVAHRAAKSISGLRSVEGRMLHASASIGISVYPNDGHDVETLIKYADVAMYQAKSAGRHTYRFYQPDMQKAVNQRLAVEGDLRHALELDQLRLYYQPIVDLSNGRIIAAEALLRWQHPERGLLGPGEFVSVAEETGMIVPIGRWVLKKAACDAVAWHHAGIDVDVNVNVSPRQFREPDLDQHVVDAIRGSGILPERLHLEVTESLLMDQQKSLDITLKLKQLGVKIDLDDFGTGYSSMGRITEFPIDGLKVDRSFVLGLGNDDRSGVIAHAIIDLARNLGISVVAEGIETAEQLRILRKFGCLVGQGYLFSRPITEVAFRELFLKEAARLAG
jgi:diguanylate cyclase (GGDEF)-like protein